MASDACSFPPKPSGQRELSSQAALRPLTLAQQIVLCQQVAKIIGAKLPLADGLQRLAEQGSDDLSHAATQTWDRLQLGQSLDQAMRGQDSRQSQILAACIQVGQATDQLDYTLQSWTSMHLANWRGSRKLAVELFYPVCLIVIALMSVSWSAWHLIPEIVESYTSMQVEMPVWLQWLTASHRYLLPLLVCTLLALLLPIVWGRGYRTGMDQRGLPRHLPTRSRLQALAAGLARLQLSCGRPLSEIVPRCLAATGVSQDQVHQGFEKVQRQESLQALSTETALLIASLHAGVVSVNQAVPLFDQIARQLSYYADELSNREARWLPIGTALAIGLITVTVYGLLVYLPWIELMRRVNLPPG
jgi:hypothetical protein